LRELARKIGNRLVIYKIEGIELYSKLYKLPRALLPTSLEYIKYLIYPGLRFNLLVVIIFVLTLDCYIGIPLLLRLDWERLIVFYFSQSIVHISSEIYYLLSLYTIFKEIN
jgi:hypothetical protein